MAEQVPDRAGVISPKGPTLEEWEAAKRLFPIGAVVVGRVVTRMAFGVFLELPSTPVLGLIRLTDLDPAGTPTPPFSPGVPKEDSEVEGVVIGHAIENQILISRRLDHYDVFAPDAAVS